MRTVQQAAREASLGEDNPLWLACFEIARAAGYSRDQKVSNQQMCERAIRSMTQEKRRAHNITGSSPWELPPCY